MFDNIDFCWDDIYEEKNNPEPKEFNDEYDDEFWEENENLEGWQ